MVRLRDLGLEQYSTVELFAGILLPASFLLACILQLYYFNDDFLKLTDLNNIPVNEGGVLDRYVCKRDLASVMHSLYNGVTVFYIALLMFPHVNSKKKLESRVFILANM